MKLNFESRLFCLFLVLFSSLEFASAALIQRLAPMSMALRENGTKDLGANSSHQLVLSSTGNLILRAKNTGAILWQSNTNGRCTKCHAQFRSTGFLVLVNLENNQIYFRNGAVKADSIEFHTVAPFVRIKKSTELVWSDSWKETRNLDGILKEAHVGADSFYSLHDNAGRSLDGLQIQQENSNELVGIYHTLIGPDKFCLRLATARVSQGLRSWIHTTDVDCDYASQGEIKRLPDGKYLMAYEKNPTGRRPFIRFRFYNSYQALISNQVARQFDAPFTPGANADGTPNFRWIRYDGNPDSMTVEIGFHYNRSSDGRDVNAIGFLRGFQSFDSYPHNPLNDRLYQVAGWHLGDRTFFQYGGRNYTLVEAMTAKNDWNSWRLFLYDESSGHLEPIQFATPKNSPSHGNPSLQVVKIDEAYHLIGTTFIFESSEGGAHLYSKRLSYGVGGQSVVPQTVSPEFNLIFHSYELRHHIGRQEANGWSVVAGESGHMIFGPYTRALPHAPMAVNFVFMVDNNTAENHEVITFDVYDATAGEVLATRVVRRQELPTPFTWGIVSLGFDMRFRAGHAIEARMYSHGISYIKFSHLSFVD